MELTAETNLNVITLRDKPLRKKQGAMMSLIHPLNLSALQALLETHAQEGVQAYLLLDGALAPRLLKAVKKSRLPWCSVFTQSDQGPDDLLSVSPLLVACSAQDSASLHTLLTPFAGLPLASVWHTPESLHALAARLRPWCVVEADGSFLNLRYPDARRLRDLDRVLDDTQRAQFFGPAHGCHVPDRYGEGWHPLSLPAQSHAPALKVVLDAAQTHALIRAAEADEILFQLHFHQRIQPAVLADAYPATETALLLADAQNQDSIPQRIAACLAALQPQA